MGAGCSISADLKSNADANLVIVDQDFEPTKTPTIPDIDCELEYAKLPDPIDVGVVEYYIVKSKTNPFKSICEWHSQLSKQLGGNFRKVIYWKRIRSRTWTKSKKPSVSNITSVAQLIFVVVFIIKL
ncbi:hypothetical protein D0T60_01725 [Bacteroides sp. 224]|nr:hypothetical protein [Bacteroides sp. 224]